MLGWVKHADRQRRVCRRLEMAVCLRKLVQGFIQLGRRGRGPIATVGVVIGNASPMLKS